MGLIILGLLIIGFFGMRTVHAFREFHGHRPPPHGKLETDVELIRDWMTIPFISRMYQVPPPVLFEALDIPPQGNQDKSLKLLNDEYYPGVRGFVEAKVKTAILENQPPAVPTPSN